MESSVRIRGLSAVHPAWDLVLALRGSMAELHVPLFRQGIEITPLLRF
jgi:hypothetical protein